MNESLAWGGPTRVPFLVLTPACIVLGVACVKLTQGHVDLSEALLVLLGALAAHISVNAFNEYQDFHSGLDALMQRTPFSGGSGVLPAHPELAGRTLVMAVGCRSVSIGVGLYFVDLRGPALLTLGAAAASPAPFFLVNKLLLLNQFADSDADRRVGRRHIFMSSESVVAARWYAAFTVLAFSNLGLSVLAGLLPVGALLGPLRLAPALGMLMW